MRRNLSSSLARRRQTDPMSRFDALPPDLRAWLRDAVLPWSPSSALRIWNRACREGGPAAALQRLEAVEIGTLARDRKSISAQLPDMRESC